MNAGATRTAIRTATWTAGALCLALLLPGCGLPGPLDAAGNEAAPEPAPSVDGPTAAASPVPFLAAQGGTPGSLVAPAPAPPPADTTAPMNDSCFDHERNGTETDVDCGGLCAPCQAGQFCRYGADCLSAVCTAGVCADPTCDDGVMNGGESDVDCGGNACVACEDGRTCARASDCRSGVCKDLVCAAVSCTDGVRNGNEADVDCGGSCPGCLRGAACSVDADCESGLCNNDTGRCR